MSSTMNVEHGADQLPRIGFTPAAPAASQVRVTKAAGDVAVILDLGFSIKLRPVDGGGEAFGRIAGAALTRDEAESLILAIQRELGTVPNLSPVVPSVPNGATRTVEAREVRAGDVIFDPTQGVSWPVVEVFPRSQITGEVVLLLEYPSSMRKPTNFDPRAEVILKLL